MYSDKENINILTSLLVAYGIEHVVVCPGSRNAPLVHNFVVCPDLRCHSVTDERSAAFVALGIASQTRGSVAVCVTSGSALLNTLPAVAEAKYQQKKILVISADRPQAWVDQLDGQTIPQPGALGKFVADSVTLPECKDDDERWLCRRLVCQAIIAMCNNHCPAHINVPISEPLFAFNTEELPVCHAVLATPIGTYGFFERIEPKLRNARRPMIVVGQYSEFEIDSSILHNLRLHYVVLAEQLARIKPSPSLDTAFKLMGDDREPYEPDLVIYCGGNTISKRLRLFLRSLTDCEVILVNEDGILQDPTTHATEIIRGDATDVLEYLSTDYSEPLATPFHQEWEALLAKTAEVLEAEPERLDEKAVWLFEQVVARESNIFYANSSSIRWAAKYARHFVRCNRGVNGIEGSLSTAVGAALVTDENVFCVVGDLSFFYDQNALWNQRLSGNMRVLLLNNGGGQIFSTLPGLDRSPARNEYVTASHSMTAEGASLQYGMAYRVVTDADQLADAIDWLVVAPSHRPMLLEIRSTT